MRSNPAAGTFSRRAFAKLATTALGLSASIARMHTGLAASNFPAFIRSKNVYVFDSAGETGAGCTCKACLRHAAHKRFVSFEAADARRAHPGCTCAIRALPVSNAEFVRLFGRPESGDFRPERDLRASV
jgi:hypothetical protein